jgi:hypothetical protein
LSEALRIQRRQEAPVKRTVFRLLDLAVAVALSLMLANISRVHAATFEVGTRHGYSIGQNRLAFTNKGDVLKGANKS